jgi:cysteine-rich repeat protein
MRWRRGWRWRWLQWYLSGGGWVSNWCLGLLSYSWIYSDASVGSVWQIIWGDSKKLYAEEWDDGNTANGDGCSSTCTIEIGWNWAGGNPSTPDTCSEIWGDAKRIGNEGWDDGNTSNGDGWNSSCFVDPGWTWSGGTSSTSDTCTEIWGDGIRFNSFLTYWDDGNMNDNDGWSSTCSVENGYECTGGTSITADTCSSIVWGDGKTVSTEEWDDNNTFNGDGCSSTCTVEIGWEWTNTYGSISVWTKIEVEIVPAAVIHAAIGAAMVGSVVASSMSCSSPSGLWQIMNLMQLLMFLILLGVYLPVPIKDIINSSSFFSFSLPIPHLGSLYGIGHFFEFIDVESEDSALSSLGAESGSTFINVLSQLLMLLLILILHLLSLTLRNWDPNRAHGWLSKWVKWTGKKNLQILHLHSIHSISFTIFPIHAHDFDYRIECLQQPEYFPYCLFLPCWFHIAVSYCISHNWSNILDHKGE